MIILLPILGVVIIGLIRFQHTSIHVVDIGVYQFPLPYVLRVKIGTSIVEICTSLHFNIANCIQSQLLHFLLTLSCTNIFS